MHEMPGKTLRTLAARMRIDESPSFSRRTPTPLYPSTYQNKINGIDDNTYNGAFKETTGRLREVK